MSNYHETNDYGLFSSWGGTLKPYHFYALNTSKTGGGFIVECIDYNSFSFTLPKTERSEWEEVAQQVVEAFDPSYEIFYHIVNEENIVECTVYDKNLNPDTLRNAKAICAELKEQGIISSFVYSGEVSNNMSMLETLYLTGYYTSENLYDGGISLDELEVVLNDYIVEKNLDCHIVRTGEDNYGLWETKKNMNAVCVVPNKELTLDEHLKLAAQIKNDLGYAPLTISPASSDATAFATEIDLFNATYGDLNDDSKLTPVDASLLLSYYSESQIGTETEADMTYELLGDVNNDGKVTPVDASLVLRQYAENQTK